MFDGEYCEENKVIKQIKENGVEVLAYAIDENSASWISELEIKNGSPLSEFEIIGNIHEED